MSTTPKMLKIALIAIGLSLGLVAQETESTAERSVPPPAVITAQDNDPPVEEALPDTRPITGFLPLTVGSFGTERSFLAPTFRFSQSLDTNPLVAAGTSENVAVTNLGGNVLLQRVWRESQLSVDYSIGGSLYAGHSELDRSFQAAQIKQVFQFRRWSLTLMDDVTYTPESTFGYAGLTQASSFTPGTAPNQTILNNQSQQINNVAGAQFNYELNRRSSITLAGDYGLLRFPGSSLLESDQAGFQAGYNHNLNSRDSVGIGYGFTSIWYPDSLLNPRVDSHNVGLAYGRKVTGRLALRVSAGPQIYQYDDPVLGAISRASWTAQGSLLYRLHRAQVKLGYGHTLNGGAGVLALVRTDEVDGGVESQLTRTVAAHLRAGYAHNSNLQAQAGPASLAFNTEFVAAGLRRPLGRTASAVFDYSFQHQSANLLSCGLGLCGSDLYRHVASIGFEWRMRPILIH